MRIAPVTFRVKDPVISFRRNPAPGEHHFAAESSDLLGAGRHMPDMIRLTVEASGNTRDFGFAMTALDREREVVGWVYATNDALAQMRFMVFND